MMSVLRLFYFSALFLSVAVPVQGTAQNLNTAQQVPLLGLRTSAGHGGFPSAAFGASGAAYVLYDQGDGIRVLKTDASGSTVQTQTTVGASGDVPLLIATDPAGNVYVAGTSTSGSLQGSAGAAFPHAADTSTNSFIAKYDANLKPLFLTFLGSGRTVVTGLAATSDAVFVTGITFNSSFAVTAAGIQQTPASGSTENGFVERFSSDGSTLVYATYVTGVNGDTMPAALTADSSDNAYIAGSTSSSGLPTLNALTPQIILAPGATTSGFLTKLTPAGDGFVFSTFLAGGGVTGIALDFSTNSLLLTGNFAPGGFPSANLSMPITSDTYQSLVRIPVNGSSVSASLLLLPSPQSFVSVDAGGGAWVSGKLGTPIFPGVVGPAYTTGDTFLLHVNSTNVVDRTFRFGGVAETSAAYTTLSSTVSAPAIATSQLLLPGTLTASVNAGLLAAQRFDVPLTASNALLPNTVRDLVPSASSCAGSTCNGSAGLLGGISLSDAPSLAVSADDLPNLTLRNLGSASAMGLTITASGYSVGTNCGTSLAPSAQCGIALTGSGPGTLTIAATNAATMAVPLAATSTAAAAISLSAVELDFGIVSSAGQPVTRSLTVSNLTGATQSFPVGKDGGAASPATFAVASSDCAAGSPGSYSVPAGGSCHFVFSLAASTSGTNDGPVQSIWKVGTRNILLTGFSQAAAVSLSASTLDFGAQFNGAKAIQLPRYLFLSNNSDAVVTHTAVGLPSTSAFTVVDECPSQLPSHSACRITARYSAPTAPSSDSVTLTLDSGQTVLLTGRTLAAASANGSSANPSLSLSTGTITFSSPVVVTGVASSTQAVTVKNTGNVGLPLAIGISGDFTLTNGCPATLASGSSCMLSVGFTPSQPGPVQGLVSVTAGSSFAPAYVTLSGTGIAILPPNNGTLALGQTLAGEPVVAWYKVQQPLSTLTVTSNAASFGVALVQDTGYGHGTLPPSSFTATATSNCSNCWLGVQFLSQTTGAQAATLQLSTASAGKPYVLAATAASLPVQGLLLSPVQRDFGTVAVHSTSSSLTFTLANLLAEGASSLTIQNVTASGDFTVITNQTGGPSCTGTLAPAASCFIQLTFAPAASGQRTGQLTVVTNQGSATSSLSGYGAPDPGIAISPASLSFSNVPGTSATQQTVTLTNTSAVPAVIGNIAVAAPFSAQSNCATLQPGSQCTIVVGFMPQFADASGAMQIPVSKTINGQGSATTYSVALDGSYTTSDAGLQILPSEVNFGATSTASVGETRLFTLNNLSGKPLNVTLSMPRQFAAGSNAACPTLAVGASCSFPVTFLPETAGALTGTVFAQGISTDGATSVQALAYMLGYGHGLTTLALSGPIVPNTPLDFGQVASGQASQKTLTVTNIGTQPLTVRRLLSEPPFLAATTCASALAPAASCSVTLTYAPVNETAGSGAATRQDAGSLVIESDAISSPDILDLKGMVTPAVSASPASATTLAVYTLSQGSLTFGNTTVGNVSPTQTLTLLNTGTTTIHLLQTIAPPDFTVATGCTAILPGASCPVTVGFTPGNASTAPVRSGSLEFFTDAGTALEFVSLLGSSVAAPLTLSPTNLDFGTANVGDATTLTVTLTNQSAAPVTITGFTASGDYTVSSLNCPAVGATLAGGASCTLQVTLKPTATGTRTGVLSVATDATKQPLTVSLTANAVQSHLQILPGALAFGSVSKGATASLTFTLSNTGSAPVTSISGQISGINAANYAVTVPCALSSLPPGQSCNETVSFTPSVAGPSAATLTITSSDPSSPVTIPLTGTGVGAGTFLLTVNGGSSTSVTVAAGNAATYSLAVTPQNGYTGSVALTCTPVNAGLHTTCSLLSSTLTLAGATPSTSTATITTIASALMNGGGALLLLPLAFMRKRKWAAAQAIVVFLVLASVFSVTMTGCGTGTLNSPGGSGTTVLKTPPGSYQYTVTASSTSGTIVSSSVTLTLVVQ